METFTFEDAQAPNAVAAGGGDTGAFSFEEAIGGPMQKEPPKEKSDWETAKESLGKMIEPAKGTEPGTWDYYKGMGREAFLESNPLVNLGAWAIKKATGQETEGDLQKFPAKPEPGFAESLKEGVKFMAEHPLTATAELAKGLLYSPELTVLAFSKGPEMAARAAEMAKLGRAARAVAVTGESALEGGAAMGGISVVQQAAQKESVNWGEVGAQATIGAAMIPALRGISKGLEAGNRWARGGKVEAPEVPGPDRFSDWVEAGGEIRSPGEEIYRQPNVFRDLPGDTQLNAAARADKMMQEGASKKAADVATNKNPELAAAMEAVRQKRADAAESFGRGVLQGEVLGPEVPRGPAVLTAPAGEAGTSGFQMNTPSPRPPGLPAPKDPNAGWRPEFEFGDSPNNTPFKYEKVKIDPDLGGYKAYDAGLDYSQFKAEWESRGLAEKFTRYSNAKDAAVKRATEINKAWEAYKAEAERQAKIAKLEDKLAGVEETLRAQRPPRMSAGENQPDFQSSPNWRERGEADPRLLAALGLTVGAGMLAAAYPEKAKEYAGEFALGGALLATAGKAPQALRTLGGELAQGRYTLKTLERLPQNRTEIPKTMIEQQLRRNDVPKAERDVLEGILKTKGEQVPAAELVRDFRLATGDHTLEAKETGQYADYGLERIGRERPYERINADTGVFYRPPGGPASTTTTLYRLPEHMEVSDANHFRDPRLFGWTRSFEEGGIKHVVEVQSDLAQKAGKVLTEGERESLLKELGQITDLRSRIKELTRNQETPQSEYIKLYESLPEDIQRQVISSDRLWGNIQDGTHTLKDITPERWADKFKDYEYYNADVKQSEIHSKVKEQAIATNVGPMLKHWPRRLIREELARETTRRARELEQRVSQYPEFNSERVNADLISKARDKWGKDYVEFAQSPESSVVRFADADTVAKVEGWPEDTLPEAQKRVETRIRELEQIQRESNGTVGTEELRSMRAYQANNARELSKPRPRFQEPGHQSIYDRYKTDIESYLKSLGGKHVTDSSGHGWYEVQTQSQAGRINQYGKADPKLLGGIALVGAGMLAGGLLAGDSKVAGAILGGIAGAGLMRLPRTLAGLGKTLSWKQATWNAARVGAVLGAGTYIGGKTGDPVYGAAVASAIILGKAALKPARKLTTDQFISIRNGNIASQQRMTDNMVRDINAAIPDPARRVAVSEALDRGSPEGLAPKERQVYGYVRQFLDNIGKEATDAEVIKGMRANYISYIVERDPTMTLEQESGILRRIFESGEGGSSGSPNTRFGKRGKYETFDEINAALKGSGLRLKTQDVGEIVGLYTKSMRTAIENKILLDNLKQAKSPAGESYIVRQDKNNNVPQGYEKLNHPQMMGYGVHPDLVDSLKVVLNNSDPNVVTRGLHGLAMAVKRVQVFGSLFHAKSLMEVYINAMGKDFYSTRTGVNMKPINAALKMYEKGGLGDTLDLGIKNGLSMQIPLDVSQSIIGDIGKAVNNITPRLVGKELKIGTAVTDKIDWVTGKLDKLTWDYLHAGIKGAVFLKEFETLTLRNAEAHAANPKKVPLKSREQIAREVATYANDLTGGLNWFNIAADAKTQLGRQLGMFFAGPEGQRFAQMLAFAPDWAVSTLRAGFKAFGESDRTLRGLWKPENATDLYRRYALRSTLYWITLLNGINYMTSGHSIFENKDPTRLEFEDGTSMQAGKHTFEAVHAATDPVRFAYNKLGFAPKMLVDRMSGKSGYGDTAPKFETFAGHAAQAALPFTVNTAMQPGLTPRQRVTRPTASAIGFPIYGTSPEQKATIKIERAAAQERRRQTRKDWGGKE